MKAAIVALVLLCVVSAISPEEMSLELLEPEEAEIMAARDPLQYGCSGDLGLVYASGNLRKPATATGCGYAQYNPKTCNGTLNLVNCKSSICADVNQGKGGRSVLAYNSKLNKLEYFATGTGNYVWAILPTSGAQSPFALLPEARSLVIGLALLGQNLYLFTSTAQYFIAPVPTTGKVPVNLTPFSAVNELPVEVKLNPNSLVASDGVDLFYFITAQLTVLTYSVAQEQTVASSLLGVDIDIAQQLFYTPEAGLIFVADDILYRLNATNGTMTPLVGLPKEARGATLSTTNYWFATNTTMTKYDIKANTFTSKPIAGEPIVGNFVYIS